MEWCTRCKVALNRQKAYVASGKVMRGEAAHRLNLLQDSKRQICNGGECCFSSTATAWQEMDPQGYAQALANHRAIVNVDAVGVHQQGR